MKKITFLLGALLSFTCTLQAQYIPNSGTRINTPLTHDGNVRIGSGTSSTDRIRNVLNFGDGDYVKIGEWEEDDVMSFKAKLFKFGNSINMPYGKEILIGDNWREGYNRFRLSAILGHVYIDFKENMHFRADKNWVSALTLYGDGTVGVGFNTTYSPGNYRTQGYKLAVNGEILCEGIKVINDVPDADYVFEEDYNLSSLAEVELFIKENKHLPDIPSAEQFKANGYTVGEMDEMLLRKVEEITLYLIQQQKRMDILEKENKELKEKLNQ